MVKVSKTKDINNAIRKQSRRSKTVKISGLNGQNYIAVGINIDKQLTFDGSAGDFFGALNHGAILNLKGKARRFIGDTMSRGGIILQGNAGRGVGTGLNGGIIVIRGNVAGDVGQLASGGTIIVSGNGGSNIGAFMNNGEIIIGGKVGNKTGHLMTGGAIFVGGSIGSLGKNTEEREISKTDKTKIVKYFKHYGISKDVDKFKKIVPKDRNPTLKNRFNTHFVHREPAEHNFFDNIQLRAKTGLMTFSGPTNDFMKTNFQSFFDRLSILPVQIQDIKDWDKLDFEVDYDLSMKLGSTKKSPLESQLPFYLESRGPGIVSTSTQMAFLYAADKTKTAVNLGGLMLPEELERQQKYNNILITQWYQNRFGLDVEYLKKSSAIELVLGHGGFGSLPFIIPKNKITPELRKLWDVGKDIDIYLPPMLPDFDVPADLKRHVELLHELTDHQIPIFIRLAAGNVYEDTKLAIRAGADAVVIDCIDTFRQNSPTITATNFGLFSVAAIAPAVKAIKDTNAKKQDFKLIVSGFFRNGADIFKALALGADMAVINTAAEVAIGCKLCGKCNLNNCPEGIGTTNPKLETKLDWVDAGKKLAKFLKTLTTELKLIMLLSGCRDLDEIGLEKLRAYDYEVASITGVKLSGFDSRLPMWDH